MSTARYDELVSLYIDGEPSAEELNELEELLKSDEKLALDFQDQLITWDAWSQETAPERSADSFFAGVKTRVRAEKDAPAFELSVTQKLKQRRLPMPFHPIIAVAATAALMLIFVQVMLSSSKGPTSEVIAQTNHICVNGECICTHCTLNQTEEHIRAVRYRGEGGKTEIVLLKNNPEMNMKMRHFCRGPTPVLVEGDIENIDGQLTLTATAFKTFESSQDNTDSRLKTPESGALAFSKMLVVKNDLFRYNPNFP